MELVYRRREKVVGLFLVLTALLTAFALAAIGRGKDWFRSYVHYSTVFHEAYNLDEKAPVKMAKATIGKVKSIDLEGDKVRVELSILAVYAHRIRKGSVATVESPTLIGAEYVSIKPGDPAAPAIPENGLIPSEAKKSVADILNEFKVEETAKKIVTAAQELTDIIHKMHEQDGPLFQALAKLNLVMAHVESVLAAVDRGEGTLGGAIRSDRLLVAIEENMTEVRSILVNLDRATARIPSVVERVGETAQKSGGVADETKGAVVRVQGAVDQARTDLVELQKVLEAVRESMARVQKILENVEKASHDVPRVTESTKKGVEEVREGVRQVDRVVRSVQQLPLIRGHVPPEPAAKPGDAGLRP